MKKLTALLLSAALVSSLAISMSAFASGTGDSADAAWDYPYYKTTATAASETGVSNKEGPASFAVDGDSSSYWHSRWGDSGSGDKDLTNLPDKRYIQLELEEEVEVTGLRYLPRPSTGNGDANGMVTDYRVEVSTTGQDGSWKVVASGVWSSNDHDWKLAAFDTPTQAKYVRLYGEATIGDDPNKFMSCGELRVQTNQAPEGNIFLGKTASASSQLSGQEAGKANDENGGTKWCADWTGHSSADYAMEDNWWQVDLGWGHHVDTLTLLFETSAQWKYHVAVSNDPTFADYTILENAITTVTASKAVVNVNQDGRYVRVYLKPITESRWPCLWDVYATGSSLEIKPDLEALVREADSKRAEWYTRGWEAYLQAVNAGKELLEQANPEQAAMTQAIADIKAAKDALVEREQYTADDPFVFPSQPAATATLEAEFGQLQDVKLSSDGQWHLQVSTGSWASHGEYLNSFNQQDTATYYYNAPVAGAYSVTATYRSGSASNQLAWSGTNIQAGTATAGASDDASQSHEVTFELVVTQAGAGTLVFTGPDTKSPQLDKLEITLTEVIYPITVNNPSEGGTATANPTTAAAGDTVTLNPVANEGYHFVEWQVDDETVVITDNTFTMPEKAVTITPVFEAHSYGYPEFHWAEDGKSATATFTCDTCGHAQTVEATITTDVVTPATCTAMGVSRYTGTVNFGGKDYTATKEVTDIPALGHHVTLVEGKAATCTEAGTKAYYVCDRCQAAFEDEEATTAIDNPDEWKVLPATGHKTERQNTKEVTCTQDGYTGDLVCTVCGTVVEKGEVIKATGHTEETIPGKAATCTEDGLTEGTKCSVCGEILKAQEVIEATGHTEETVPGKAATCTEDGLTEGTKCSVCEAILKEQEVIQATGHTEETVPGKAATCTEDGLTEGAKCSVCGVVLKEQEVIKATGHTEETIPGKAATCTEDGLTEGTRCSVCEAILKEQEVIKATGHTEETIPGKAATCTEDGLTEGTKCSVCEAILKEQEVIKATGHTEETIPGKAATCTEDGLTEGTKCSVCEAILKEQEVIKATGHTEETIPGKAATCTEDGLTEGTKCSVCEAILKEQEVIKATGHTEETIPGKAATCTEDGLTEGTKCSVCGVVLKEQEVIQATGHTEETIPGKAATCTEDGLTEGAKCSVCGVVLKEQEVIKATGHTEETIPGKAATCTEDGLTEGTKCSVCEAILKEQEVIKATGHTEETVPGKAATCTEDGLTEGTRCSVCGVVLKEQEVIQATGHTQETIPGKAATCTEDGLTEGTKCSVCGVVLKEQEVIQATGHTEETIPGKAATCTEDGLTEGTKCSVCGVVLKEQEVIQATGHTEETIPGKAATCTEDGLTEGAKCSVCGVVLKEQEVIKATGHTEETIPGKAATCTEDGLTEGAKCSVCGVVLKEQEVIKATGHTEETIPGKAATCTEDGLTEGTKCSVCGVVLKEQEVIKATGHDYVDGVCTQCGAEDPDDIQPTDPVEPSAPVTGDQVTVDNNSATHITVGNAEQVFDKGTVITVESVGKGEVYNTVEKALKELVADMKHTAILDITATLGGQAVQPNGKVQMTFQIPENLAVDNLKLFYVSDDGKATEEIAITVNKDTRTVTANLEHFSTYVLANVKSNQAGAQVPPTGDEAPLMAVAMVLVISMGAFAALMLVERKRRSR